ncbi:hypothetical protein V6N13_043945 [Hibiscus sabdariffa]
MRSIIVVILFVQQPRQEQDAPLQCPVSRSRFTIQTEVRERTTNHTRIGHMLRLEIQPPLKTKCVTSFCINFITHVLYHFIGIISILVVGLAALNAKIYLYLSYFLI